MIGDQPLRDFAEYLRQEDIFYGKELKTEEEYRRIASEKMLKLKSYRELNG